MTSYRQEAECEDGERRLVQFVEEGPRTSLGDSPVTAQLQFVEVTSRSSS